MTTTKTTIKKNFCINLSKSLLIILIVLTICIRRRQQYDNNFDDNNSLSAYFGAQAAEIATNLTNKTTTTTNIRKPAPRLRLNKCCYLSEHLDMARNCVPGNPKNWVPLIFFPKNQNYYEPKGESPKFMSFQENTLPLVLQKNVMDMATRREQAYNNEAQCTSADELEFFTGANNIILFGNGSIVLRELGQLIVPSRYCIDHNTALVCFPRKTDDMREQPPLVKIRKCCSPFSAYDTLAKNCRAMPDATDKQQLELPLDKTQFQTIYGFPTCEKSTGSYAIIGDWSASSSTQLNTTDGSLQVQNKNFVANDFCLEHTKAGIGNSSSSSFTTTSSKSNLKLKIFTCLHHFATGGGSGSSNDEDASLHSSNISPTGVRNNSGGSDSTTERLQVAVLNIGLVISVVFLAATLIASYLMPSVHHVLHWRCQIFYVFCLFCGDFLLAYTQLATHHSLDLGSVKCLIVASAMQFFFLSAFFWLNTMCFNIWWTFRDFRPSSLERNQELLRLRLYCAYAWGIPLLITVIAAFIDQLPAESQLLRPGFGVRSCWFSGEHLSIFAYFFGPIGILLCANIALFISTTHQLTCGLWKREDVKSTTEKTALGKVCLKLVVVMGVTWIADVISWLIGGPHSAWFPTDLINALQGVFIFIVVGCQPQVWAACKRFCCPRSRQEITNTTNGVQHSSSSQGLPSLAACGAEITQNTSIHGATSIGGYGGNGGGGGGGGVGGMQQSKPQQQQQTKIPMETVC